MTLKLNVPKYVLNSIDCNHLSQLVREQLIKIDSQLDSYMSKNCYNCDELLKNVKTRIAVLRIINELIFWCLRDETRRELESLERALISVNGEKIINRHNVQEGVSVE